MPKINLDPQSEQSILNMLLDHSVLNDSSISKIVNTSKEIGKTKIETAIELKLTDEQKILKILSSSYSLDVVDLNEKKLRCPRGSTIGQYVFNIFALYELELG